MKQGKNDMEYDPFVIAQWIAASLTGGIVGGGGTEAGGVAGEFG